MGTNFQKTYDSADSDIHFDLSCTTENVQSTVISAHPSNLNLSKLSKV